MPAMTETDFMARALDQAGLAAAVGEVPVGAVLVDGATEKIIASAHNLVETNSDPTAHAEMLVLRAAAAKSGAARLTGCDLYVTLEPCPMCAQAISLARLRRLYFGAYDAKGGGVEHGPRIFSQTTCHHAPEVIGGVNEIQCAQLLKDFFAERR
jgi:tRNA(Arg) A34 adenosine deaminase TadA